LVVSTDHTESLDTRRVMLHCGLPLTEILVDFNDKIKSITRRYGSMDYEHAGDRPANSEGKINIPQGAFIEVLKAQ
jgi:translation elongation factor EF-4